MMRLTEKQHLALWKAYLKDAAAAKLTLPQKRELQRRAGNHKALAAKAAMQMANVLKIPAKRKV